MDPNTTPLPQQSPQLSTQPEAAPETKTGNNTLAIVGFVLAFVFPIAGIVASSISLVQIKRTGQKGKGFAITGLVLSMVFIIVSILGVAYLFHSQKSNFKTARAEAITEQYIDYLIDQDYASAYSFSAKELDFNRSLTSFKGNLPISFNSSCRQTTLSTSVGRWKTPGGTSELEGVAANTVSSKVECASTTYNIDTYVVNVDGTQRIARSVLK